MTGPLRGIRVVDMTMNVMGPLAAQILGDMGADVIKVEPPEGDTLRGVGPSRTRLMGPMFLHLNRNKRSLVLDLKKPASRAVLHRLVGRADVLLSSLRPAAMARLGASWDELAALNPRLVYCAAFGYGQDGPYAAKPAYDDLIQGAIGLPVLQGRGIAEPNYVVTAIIDRTVGMAAASAVGMALFHRERTGEGQKVEIPMFETMAEFVMGDHLWGRTFEPPVGPTGYVRMLDPQRKPYRTQDGYVCALIYTNRHWARFFALAGKPELADDPRYATITGRTQNIAALYALVAELFLGKTSAEWLALLAEADIPSMALNTPDSLIDDPHMRAVGFFREIDHPTEGRLRTPGIPSRWSRSQPEITREVPVLGQHSVEVLEEYGYDAAEIAALLGDGVAVDGRPKD